MAKTIYSCKFLSHVCQNSLQMCNLVFMRYIPKPHFYYVSVISNKIFYTVVCVFCCMIFIVGFLSQNEHINKLQRAIKNEQFSDTGKIGYTRRKQTKQKQITQHRILKR